jgi:hypothetical protein
LNESGELFQMLPASDCALFAFGQMFRTPNILLYALDQNEVWFATWLTSVERALVMSMWCDERHRGTRQQAEITRLVYEVCFQMCPVIIGFTKRPALLRIHERIGYQVLGRLPKFFDGTDDAWLVMLTKDNFKQGALYDENLYENSNQ